jgi:hypothetical protein
MLKRKIKYSLIFAVAVFTLGMFFVQNAFAETVTMTASCTGTKDTDACDNFTDVKIDGARVEKVELLGATFDDSGQINTTSPSGKKGMIPSVGTGCLQTHPYEDVTDLFLEKGMYTVHIISNNDCGDAVSAYAYLKVTYTDKPCTGSNLPACDNPGPCEAKPGKCVVEDGSPTCKYEHSDAGCSDPGAGKCLVGPGTCTAIGGKATCKYHVDNKPCNADGNTCTYDTCVSNDGGITASCKAGTNICGGLVPCGRLADDPKTPGVDESKSCGVCSLVVLLSNIINFLMEIVALVTLLALIVGGIIYVTTAGNVSLIAEAKQRFGRIIQGFIIIFISWVIINLIMVLFGFNTFMGSGSWAKFTCNF